MGTHAKEARPADPAPTTSHLPVADWDDLLNAVKDRLRLTVAEQRAATAEPLADRVRQAVLDGVEALDLLHASVTRERHRYQQLERQLQALQADLAKVRVPSHPTPAAAGGLAGTA
jgi:hypothetical protein